MMGKQSIQLAYSNDQGPSLWAKPEAIKMGKKLIKLSLKTVVHINWAEILVQQTLHVEPEFVTIFPHPAIIIAKMYTGSEKHNTMPPEL